MTPVKTITHTVHVEFGDCDPAGIVWFPNFFRWIDAASRHYFSQCGVPRWEETTQTLGVIGTPLVDTHSRFLKTASYGDVLHIRTQITEWRDKSFVQTYRIMRPRPDGGEDAIMDCDEVRIFAAKREDGKNGIRAVPIPPSLRTLCE
jgi:4-hydroxybenzoyl-CoA thioesterase